jgi:Bacterial regulatory proteins, luxR family
MCGTRRSNAEIAQYLYVSPATAKTHVARLLMKLGACARAQLIVVAHESGLVTRPAALLASWPGQPPASHTLITCCGGSREDGA